MRSNNKNNKKNKNNVKNFSIESLEPRLLMDAATVDWDKIDDSFVNDYVVDNGSLTSVAVSLYAA